ncbi:hypothetical protein [Microcoleus sp. FACHB-SPT15]|nr:hypothetical protein [Microcoleus sp. FACHB-SPT15]
MQKAFMNIACTVSFFNWIVISTTLHSVGWHSTQVQIFGFWRSAMGRQP